MQPLLATLFGPPCKFLVIEDNEMAADALVADVAAAWQTDAVQAAGSLTEARERLRIKPAVEWVFCDLSLPDVRGLELIDAVRAMAPEAKIAVVSGTRERDVARQCWARGAVAFICKADSTIRQYEALRWLRRDGYFFPTWAASPG